MNELETCRSSIKAHHSRDKRSYTTANNANRYKSNRTCIDIGCQIFAIRVICYLQHFLPDICYPKV